MAVVVLLTTMCYPYAGGGHAVLLHCEIDRQRRTFLKGKWDRLGLDNEEKEYAELHGKAVIQGLISTGGSAYVLTQEGKLYTMGYNTYSQLGRSTQDVPTTSLAKVDISDHIISIACGDFHCLAMTPTRVFAFGCNGDGQAGVPGGRHVSQPTVIYTGTGGQAPVQLATGSFHSAILTEDGQVLSFGDGSDGSTGQGSTKNIYKPTRVKSLKSKVQQIGCTEAATYFLLLDGVLLGCGDNEDSRLGVGHGETVCLPTAVETGGRKIQSFRCSLTLVVAITLSGEALVWGVCHDGTVIKIPQLVENLDHPMDVLARGYCTDTGGSVYPDNLYWCMKTIENLTPQMTELNQKMEPLALKLKMLHVDAKDDSAANRASGGDPGHQETQLLGHTSLMAEHMSLLATFKTLERKHLEQTNEFEKLRGDHQSQQTELEKLRHDHQSHQTKSEKLRRDYLSQQTELMKLRHDHQSQHAELEKLRHDHQSHQTESEKLSHDYLSQQTKLEKLRHDYESQKTQFEKLRLDYKCQQTEFASQQVLNNDLKRENTTVKDDLQNLKTQHQELQSKVEDSERSTITMAVLNFVVEEIGRDWKVLSWALGVRNAVLDDIEKTCHNIPHIALAALNNWYNMNQEHATKEVLVKALRDSDRNDIADKICMME